MERDNKKQLSSKDLVRGEKLQKELSELDQHLLVDIADHFVYGAPWTVFYKDKPDYSKLVAFYKQYYSGSPDVEIVRGSDGFIVATSMEKLFALYSVINGQVSANSIYQKAVKAREATVAKFLKDMQNSLKNGKHLSTIGIYSTNTSDYITKGGNRYNAYRLTLTDVSALLMQLGISIPVINLQATLTVSDTGTGAFISLT